MISTRDPRIILLVLNFWNLGFSKDEYLADHYRRDNILCSPEKAEIVKALLRAGLNHSEVHSCLDWQSTSREAIQDDVLEAGNLIFRCGSPSSLIRAVRQILKPTD